MSAIFSLGNGFVADHLPYPIIENRIPLDKKYINSMLDDYKPTALINCLGKTGRPNIDWCEQNKQATTEANVLLPIMLAHACAERNIKLIHISSGCIYFGESPNFRTVQANGEPIPEGFIKYGGILTMPCRKIDVGWLEADFANPQSFYSKSKYICDLAIGELPNVCCLRIRMPISHKNVSRNLISKLRGYKQVIGIPNSMTNMFDLSRCIDWAIKENKSGIFHVVNPEPLSAAQIMYEYQKYIPKHQFSIITEQELDNITFAKRSNCILNIDKLTNAGFQMTPSKQALEQCMAEYITNIGDLNGK